MPKQLHVSLSRNPMCQNLPRKFKINFACCDKHGLVRIADIGLIPEIKDEKRGFKIYLGGGWVLPHL